MSLYKKPTLKVEVDFTGVPTAEYPDIQGGIESGISFYRANNTGTFVDSRGAINGTIVSTPSTIAGPYTFNNDNGLLFDGSADGAYVPFNTLHQTTGAFSVELWMRVPAAPGTGRDIIGKRGSWLLSMNTSRQLTFVVQNDTSAGTTGATFALDVNTWYHVALVYTGAAVQIYVNGALAASGAYSGGVGAPAPGQPIRVGFGPNGGGTTLPSNPSATGISATVTVNKPASVAVGDLLVAYFHAGTNVAVNVTASPSGWFLMSSSARTTGGSGTVAQLWVKRADGTEGASFSWTLSSSCTWVGMISRCSAPDQVQAALAGFAATPTTAATLSTGSHNSLVDNALALSFFSIEETTGAGWSSISSGTQYLNPGTGSNNVLAVFETMGAAANLNTTATFSGAADHIHAHRIFVAGAAVYANVAVKDISYVNRAVTAAEVGQHYAARAAGDGTWVDITTSVRSVDIRGGRQYELDRMEARTAAIVLNDKNRHFDPANQASPYWPNVKPMKRVRVTFTHASTPYVVFTGFVERWPPEYFGPKYEEIQLTAVDGFDALSRAAVSGDIPTGYAGAQIGALLDRAYWPAGVRALDIGQYVMRGDDLNGTALATIQELADSELGVFFLDGDGNATFHDRAHRGTQTRSTTSQVSFVEASNSVVTYQGLRPSFDRDRIINNWEVSPHASVPGGTAQTVIDADSIAQYFLRAGSRTTRLASNADALAQANQLLNETARPALRFDSLQATPYTDAQWAAVLPLEISDRVTVNRNPIPSVGGTNIVRDCFVESIGWKWTPSRIDLTLVLSPISSGDYYNTIMRDGPTSYWRMDTVT